jgi:hypothetical protein
MQLKSHKYFVGQNVSHFKYDQNSCTFNLAKLASVKFKTQVPKLFAIK